MHHLYRALPEAYRVHSDPEARITVWRGAKAGQAAVGFQCSLQADATAYLINAAGQGTEVLNQIIDRHTSSSKENSPFVSVATDPRLSQLMSQRDGETMYQLELAAHRSVGDPDKIGAPSRPKGTELFVVGEVTPEDIVAVKLNNGDQRASELIHKLGNSQYMHTFLSYIHDDSLIPSELNPLGVWDTSGHWRSFSETPKENLSLATR